MLAGSSDGGDTPAVDATPGVDGFGTEGSLASTATVHARVLEAERDAGRVAFPPSVVWIETGATVTWEIERARHTPCRWAPGRLSA